MIYSTRTLPDGYRKTAEMDPLKNKGLMILFGIVGMVIFILSLIVLGSFLSWALPEFTSNTITFRLDLAGILGVLVSLLLIVLIHELIHGFFFWVFTRSRPVFGPRLQYAYAAAPDWFIPARHYWIIGLAPLVLIDVIMLIFILVAPAGWSPLLVFGIALNTAGSVGDMFIIARLLRLSPGSLVNDAGDTVSFFEPAGGSQ